MRWPLGVVFIVYGGLPIEAAAQRAREHGFAHIDALADAPDDLSLPVGDRFSMIPRTGCSAGPAAAGKRSWEQTVADFRAVPGARVEPWHGSVTSSNEAVLALLEAVPGLRLNLDVGHVVGWGGDPVEPSSETCLELPSQPRPAGSLSISARNSACNCGKNADC